MMTKQAPAIRLHSFFFSSAAYRARIALNLKGLSWEYVPVNLRTDAHKADDYRAKNPQGLVPTMEVGDSTIVTQSLVIIDHLDRLQPEPRLIPLGGPERDRVLEISYAIASEIHPLNNLRVLKYLVGPLKLSEAQKNTWYAHWVHEGFKAIEAMLPDHDGWCVASAPTMADCCLVPQVTNARRLKVDLTNYPRIQRIDAFARLHPAFAAADPTRQPDYAG